MKITTIVFMLSISLLSACSSGEKKAAELLDTAKFEEKQNNREHATKLYNEIVQKHPSSKAAGEAAARLEELRKPKP